MLGRQAFVAAVLAVQLFGGCIRTAAEREEDSADNDLVFVTDNARIAFSFPNGWWKNEKEHPFSLQCKSRNGTMNTGVFAYRREDIAADATPNTTFWKHFENLRSKRTNAEILGELREYKIAGKMISTLTMRADKDGDRFCYIFSLIEFAADKSRFAVVVQVTLPERYEYDVEIAKEIVHSAKLMPRE